MSISDKQFLKPFRHALLFVAFTLFSVNSAHGFSLALDSIATWGKFPRFCVNTYRWGDKFFNSYDSVFVVGTGNKFNVKIKSDSWFDYYAFDFDNNTTMNMVSLPCTSLGLHLTYLAVSAGYDINIGKYFGGQEQVRERFKFSFNCSLFGADFYYLSNDIGTRITRFGQRHHVRSMDLDFKGINNYSWGLDTYYFFNHKRYSQGAAFAYSKIQRKSAGTFYAGLSIWMQHFKFNFSELSDDMKAIIPLQATDYQYAVRNHNYAVKIGYAYNWVFKKNFLLAVSEAPTFGLRHGYINSPDQIKNSFAMYNKLKISFVYNYKKFFTGIIGYHEAGLIYDKQHALINMMMGAEMVAGYRFNLW
ncbi:MAG: DUF4421 domain-containing protein [Muribaculaceae bacterium]|nr:DUF4421 domain-containing protein [Muribaculaceae bacterium]